MLPVPNAATARRQIATILRSGDRPAALIAAVAGLVAKWALPAMDASTFGAFDAIGGSTGDVATTNGSGVITSASAPWVSLVIGNDIHLAGCSGGGTLRATVIAKASAGSITISPAPDATIGGVVAVWGSYAAGTRDLFSPVVGTEDQDDQATFRRERAALRVGASDTTPQNDERGFWVGLFGGLTANSWKDARNIGLFSVAFNRNGAAFGAYSACFGHDTVAYGVASAAGGAGSCAGDPAAPTSPAFEGYCSFAWGKNVKASGSKAVALCEESVAGARASLAAGYAATTDGEDGDTGTGSIALGYNAQAKGVGSIAIGFNVQAKGSPFALSAAQVAAGGTGYTPLDVLTVAGGTGTPATIRVDTVDGDGAITGITVLASGLYTVRPTGPAAVTGGTGADATFNLFWVEGGIAIGRGANPGSPMVVPAGGMGLGINTILPTIELLPSTNPAGDYGDQVLRGNLYFRGSVVATNDDKTIGAVESIATNGGGGGYGGLHFRALVGGTLTDGWMVDAGNVSGGVCLYPTADDATRLGAAARRPSVIYAVSGTINTSDEREKQDIEAIPDSWLDAWSAVEFNRYRWKSSVTEKGDGARWHVGVIAQRVRDAFQARGIDPMAIGVLCYDEWIDSATGERRDRYGVRYDQAMALECALMRRRLDRLEAIAAA